ncbi:MAG: hypothetical protein ABW185_12025, partial [Sedimenticola sp.]
METITAQWRCNTCAGRPYFATEPILKRHRETIHGPKRTCDYCPYIYTRADNYQRHLKTQHVFAAPSRTGPRRSRSRSRLSTTRRPGSRQASHTRTRSTSKARSPHARSVRARSRKSSHTRTRSTSKARSPHARSVRARSRKSSHTRSTSKARSPHARSVRAR